MPGIQLKGAAQGCPVGQTSAPTKGKTMAGNKQNDDGPDKTKGTDVKFPTPTPGGPMAKGTTKGGGGAAEQAKGEGAAGDTSSWWEKLLGLFR